MIDLQNLHLCHCPKLHHRTNFGEIPHFPLSCKHIMLTKLCVTHGHFWLFPSCRASAAACYADAGS